MATKRASTPRKKANGKGASDAAPSQALAPTEQTTAITIPQLPGVDAKKLAALVTSITEVNALVITKTQEVAGFAILEEGGFALADETLGDIRKLQTKINDILDPYISFLYTPLEQLYMIRRTVMGTLNRSEKDIKDKMAAFQLEEKKKRDTIDAENARKGQEMAAQVAQELAAKAPAPITIPPHPASGICMHPNIVPGVMCPYCYQLVPPPITTGMGDHLPVVPYATTPTSRVDTGVASLPTVQVAAAPMSFVAPQVTGEHSRTSFVKKVRVVDMFDVLVMFQSGLTPPDLIIVDPSALNRWFATDPTAVSYCPGLEVYEDAQIAHK